MRLIAVIFVLLLLPGCSLPQWRVFQRTVPATESAKPARQEESERRAAAYIHEATRPPVASAAATVEKVHQVAAGLRSSLGEPAEPVHVEDYEAVLSQLREGIRQRDAQLERWKQFGRRYAGTPLEGTGINLAGPAGVLGLAAVVALCVAVPPVGYALLRLLPVLWGFFRSTTRAVADFADQRPEAAQELKAQLSRRMDRAHKRLVKSHAPQPIAATP